MGTTETPHILCVEDNAETRLPLKNLLTDSHNVTLAPGIDERLDALESESVNLFLLDVNLGPGKSGTDFLHRVRAREETADIPVIAVTAYAMPGDREDLLDTGFDGYVGKPFTSDELIETIDRTL